MKKFHFLHIDISWSPIIQAIFAVLEYFVYILAKANWLLIIQSLMATPLKVRTTYVAH